jgi:glycosyltransferase involved in cell wall biosynthesis
MKILLYSYAFLPSLGGIETVSATIAENLVKLGHQVTVVTETADENKITFAYNVVRQPSIWERIRLVKSHDLVHANGASMSLFFYSELLSKPFIWTHGGYQLSCVDGLGWVDGEPAPLTPWQSVKFHSKQSGVKFATIQAIKLYLRRWVGQRVAANVAITNWVATRQPLKNQTVIYNPFPLDKFYSISQNMPKEYHFVYVGRLVSEKGVPDLIKAFAMLQNNNQHQYTLAIVGDGNWKEKLIALSQTLGVSASVHFLGRQSGDALYQIVAKSIIAVVPSVWEEPMGGVAIEMMAAGKNIIVSQNGGLYESTGNTALVFDNGNSVQLMERMQTLVQDSNLQANQLQNYASHLQNFDPKKLTQQYVKLYESVLKS